MNGGKRVAVCLCALWSYPVLISRAGQNHIYTPHMVVYLAITLPKIRYMHRLFFGPGQPYLQETHATADHHAPYNPVGHCLCS